MHGGTLRVVRILAPECTGCQRQGAMVAAIMPWKEMTLLIKANTTKEMPGQ